jgi:hypothetical protein
MQATAPVQVIALIAEVSAKDQSQLFAHCCMHGAIAGPDFAYLQALLIKVRA